ncbi:hypothetical protein HGRIS_012447 [Hohenbuehelia grisea]|uniref:SCD domain-containing protein n=1 Tax=Hohenbuehelia grisea TaxID=104357 RepID=A0ABR3ISA0_9AGAR
MSEDSPAPRRSQRDRKKAKHFVSLDSHTSKGKRKRNDSDSDAPDFPERDLDDENTSQDEGHSEDSDAEPKPKKSPSKTARKGKAKAAPKPKDQPATKKPRTTKSATGKAPKASGRRGRKPKVANGAFDATQVTKDTKISDDNPLFNAILNPAAALQSTVEDFLESLKESPDAAQAELINLILRACGCNDSVNGDEVVDYDGVVDALDNFTELLKQDNSPIYPLTSKLPAFKRFRKSLSEFIERLVSSSAAFGQLYTTDLMLTLQTWVIAMSSSQIRSFRHTATVVALEVETALCDVAAKVEKEAEVIGRQREGEKKRKASNKGAGAKDKQLEGKAAEVRGRRTKLAEFLKEFVDGVFVHRYRDLDPNIRAECVRAIGLWFKKYPAHFLDGSYLRYVGWVLSDSTTQVRLEAVRALSGVYEQVDFIGSLNHFTERFKPRLIEMATSDTEISVRVAVIHVLEAIDEHSLLEDEEREKVCLLIYDQEVKVRKAVSAFVKGVWTEASEERLVGRHKPSQSDKNRAGIKALAILLVKWANEIDALAGLAGDMDDDESDKGKGPSRPSRRQVPALVASSQLGRTALAVEALWDELEPVSDWEGLLDVLLLDHSAAGDDEGGQPSRGRRANGTSTSDGSDSVVDEAWRLDEVEESILLEVLVAALKRAKVAHPGSKKGGEEDTITNDITRALIKGLPRLFIKYQTDPNRIADVLLIPPLMNLDLYLEMRMITAYTGLWDDATKQFLSHSSMPVLTNAVAAIRHFLAATSLANTNSTKILELEDELSSLLRDAVAERDEIEVATFTEDEILSLGALCTRLAVLAGMRDLTSWTEEDEGGKQSSAWDIISAISERGVLGYREEETMVDQALRFLTFHIMWKAKELTSSAEPSQDEITFKGTLCTQRESLLEKLTEYAIGTQSNTVEGVKRSAFQNLLDLHVLFCAEQSVDADGSQLATASVALTMDDETQYRCAGFIQAEIERYTDLYGEKPTQGHAGSDSEDTGEDEGSHKEEGKKAKTKASEAESKDHLTSRTQLEHEYAFIDVMSTFLRAIRAGALHVRHGATLLAHYGRLGPAFDVCCKVIVEILREEGMYNDNGDLVVAIIVQALQEAFTLVLDGMVQDETHSVALSKVLATCFIIRGSQLSIVRRLDGQYVVQIHSTLLSWIGKRIAMYESNKNKNALKTALSFFRVLLTLLSSIQSRDALAIKAHLDQILAQSKVEVSPTAKMWEPLRSYEKRLSTAMTKDKAPGTRGRKSKKQADKSNEFVTSDEELTEAERMVEDDEHPASEPEPDVPQAPATSASASLPQPQQRHAIVRGQTLSAPSSPEPSHAEANGADVTPKASRKRPREDDMDVDQSSNADGEDGGAPQESRSAPPKPEDPEEPSTPTVEFRIKKRIRH